MAEDPLSSLLGDGKSSSGPTAKGLFDEDATIFGKDSSELKSVEGEKFANKASVLKQKERVERQAAAADRERREKELIGVVKIGGANKAMEKGLGFSINPEVSGSVGDVRIQATNLKDFDLLENLADKEKLNDLQESIFATLAGDDEKSKKGEDDLFGSKTKKGGSSSSSSVGTLRLGRQLNESKIDDLGSATSFLEKESDDELNYDVFGISKTKQAVKKQAVTIESNTEAAQKELSSLGIGDEDALNQLDSLTQEPSSEGRSKSKPMTATAGVPAPAEVVTDIDMDNLDLDAYISKMTGGEQGGGGGSGSSGGGLFD